MLTQFSFCNFKSYKDKTTLEMQAEKDDEFENSLLTVEKTNEKILPVAVVYGPNGGGKTNALEALISLITHVTAPINLLRYNESSLKIEAIPFKFSDDNNNIVEFEIFYVFSNYEYKYTLKLEDENVIFESLYRTQLGAKKPEKIFIRKKPEIELGVILTKNKVNVVVNDKIPYISFLAISYDIDVINEAINFFLNARFINIDSSEVLPEELMEKDLYKKVFLNILQAIDSCIIDFEFEKCSEDSYKIYTIHEVNGSKYKLLLDRESMGTIKMISILPEIIETLSSGGICIIDELDSKLHPKLLRFIIMQLFKDTDINFNNSQLFFTSHDMYTMSNEVFRRDEILFAAKNEQQESELYSLYEIRDEDGKTVNKNSSYSKQYLEGRYGSDPYFQRIKGF